MQGRTWAEAGTEAPAALLWLSVAAVRRRRAVGGGIWTDQFSNGFVEIGAREGGEGGRLS